MTYRKTKRPATRQVSLVWQMRWDNATTGRQFSEYFSKVDHPRCFDFPNKKTIYFTWITQKAQQLINTFSKVRMLVSCVRTWWRKLENLEKTTDLGWVTTTLPHVSAGYRTRATAVTSKRHAPVLSRPKQSTLPTLTKPYTNKYFSCRLDQQIPQLLTDYSRNATGSPS